MQDVRAEAIDTTARFRDVLSVEQRNCKTKR